MVAMLIIIIIIIGSNNTDTSEYMHFHFYESIYYWDLYNLFLGVFNDIIEVLWF